MINRNGFFASLVAGLPFVVTDSEDHETNNHAQVAFASSAASIQTMF
ncbi:hypothetical protein [Corynebacterium sp. HS2168-gen11]|nr:hypothetical protein [Corynebacterium sp. HS2168-gen11]MCS4536125.1 hypothetical protein [Corynebacterium sp. HS2168-gen11]